MSSEAQHTCSLCSRTFANKYNLTKHLRCVHRKLDENSDVMETEEFRCSSRFCKYSTMYSSEMKRHINRCLILEAEQTFAKQLHEMQTQHDIQINSILSQKEKQNLEYQSKLCQLSSQCTKLQTEKEMLEKQILKLETQLEKQIDKFELQMEKAQQTAQCLAERAIDRPTTVNSTTNQQHNEIGSISNVKVTTMLTDFATYQRQTDPQFVMETARQYLEKYFFDGPKGLARFLVEHIIRSDDGKLILCCTDPARKRFRFVNADSKLEEDLKAKMLTQKISVPIKQVCHEVFDNIQKKLNTEKQMKIAANAGAFQIGFLDDKITIAGEHLLSIREFDYDSSHNSDFLNELAALLRGPNNCVDDE